MTIREIKSRKHKEYEQNRKDIYYFIVKYEKHKGEMPQLTRKEATEMFNLSGWGFKSKIDYREPINGEYYLDDSEDDITVRKHKDKDMLAQFDLLTSKLRKILKVEGK